MNPNDQLENNPSIVEAGRAISTPTSDIQINPIINNPQFLPSNICSIEQVILQAIYEDNMEDLKNLKIYLRDLNFLEPFPQLFVDEGTSPLTLAAAVGSIDIVKMILQNETVDINLQTIPQGLTALKIACANGFFEIAHTLVHQGADVNQRNAQGCVPLFYCLSRLQENENYFENKHLCFKLAQLLLDNGANIDAIVCPIKNYTLLMIFCSVKEELSSLELQLNLDVIQFLLENGANSNLRSTKGENARGLSQQHPKQDIVLRLIDDLKSKRQVLANPINTQKPGLINKHSVIKIEGNAPKQTQCCSIMSSSNPEQKAWWNIF